MMGLENLQRLHKHWTGPIQPIMPQLVIWPSASPAVIDPPSPEFEILWIESSQSYSVA